MGYEQSARPDGWLGSEGAVDGPFMNEEGEGRSSCVIDGAIDQGCILTSEEGTRVHTYNFKQRPTRILVSEAIHRRLKNVLT